MSDYLYPDELRGLPLEEAFQELFMTHDGVPPRLYEPATFLLRAGGPDRGIEKRVADLAAMARSIDAVFRDYLSPFSVVGNQPQTPELTWPMALAHWTELLHYHSNELLKSEMLPELANRGFHILPVSEAADKYGDWIHAHFKEHIYPLLTPLAVDPGRPFPYISSDSLNLLVELRGKLHHQLSALRARVKIPIITPRLIRLPGATKENSMTSSSCVELIWSVDLVRHYLPELFVDMPIIGVHCFRVLRAAETGVAGEGTQLEVHGRNARGAVVRVDVESTMPTSILDWLVGHLDVISYSVVRYESSGSVMSLPQLSDAVERWLRHSESPLD